MDELIVQVGICRPYVCVCLCMYVNIFNIFSSDTTGPIEATFHVEPPWDGGTKVCSNGPGHMTVMPIYGKNLKKSSSLEPKSLWPRTLVCSIGCSSITKFVQMMTLDLVPHAFVWEKGKTLDISETIVVYDVEVGRCS